MLMGYLGSLLRLTRAIQVPEAPSSLVERLDFVSHVVTYPRVIIALFSLVWIGALIIGEIKGVPTYGYPRWLPFGSFVGGIRFFFQSRSMITEGYTHSKGKVFRVPRWRGWVYIVSGDTLVNEFINFQGSVLSLIESARVELQIPYTMGLSPHTHQCNYNVLKYKLTRQLDRFIESFMDELLPAFQDIVNQHCNETQFTTFNGNPTLTQLIIRIVNRSVVGSPICHNVEYMNVICKFPKNIFVSSLIMNIFPQAVQPLIGRLVCRLRVRVEEARTVLGPLVQERKHSILSHGSNSTTDMHHDMLQWIIESARTDGSQSDTEALVARMLVINATMVPTVSMTLMQVIINLAIRPECIEMLRFEAAAAMMKNGWSKNLTKDLPKLDSFLKESMRLNGLASMGFPRVALQDVTFSDGTRVPKGSFIAPAYNVHIDEAIYMNPLVFDPLRFYQQNGTEKPNFSKQTGVVNTSSHFLAFGHGRQACPGRFAAVALIKAVVVHIILNHDIKIEGDGTRPKDLWLGYNCSPSINFRLMFKRRSRMLNEYQE